MRLSQSVVYLVCLLARGRRTGGRAKQAARTSNAQKKQTAVGVRAAVSREGLRRGELLHEPKEGTTRTNKQWTHGAADPIVTRARYAEGAPEEHRRARSRDGAGAASCLHATTTTTTTTTTGLFAGKAKTQTKTKIILPPPPPHAGRSSRKVNTSTLVFCPAAAGWTGRPDPARGPDAARNNRRCYATLCSGLFVRSLCCGSTQAHAQGAEGARGPDWSASVAQQARGATGTIGPEPFQKDGNSVAEWGLYVHVVWKLLGII